MPPKKKAGTPSSPGAATEQVAQLLAGLSVPELQAVLGLAMTEAASQFTAQLHPPRPEVRRPRRETPVTLRVRVDLKGSRPAIWRRLHIASDAHLDEVHRILQAAFEWTDSHLHRFAVGTSAYDRAAAAFLCPFEVDEGEEDGIDARDVRLDELLVEAGDRLHYLYDFGDDWEHVIALEAVRPRTDGELRAVLVAGRNAGPPEDCGGVHGYAEMLSDGYPADEFDVAEADLALQHVLAVGTGFAPPTMEEIVRRHLWLLDRIGDSGIALTAAGYLPPAVVREAFEAWRLDSDWIGLGNREIQTIPVLEIRESVQDLRLARKYKGRLLLTAKGKAALGDAAVMRALVNGG